ncbi:MAG: hypothetical protein WBF43_06880, partial [Methylocella sp.]
SDVIDVEHARLSPAWPALARARQIDNCLNRITEGLFSSRAWSEVFCSIGGAEILRASYFPGV